MVMMMMIRSDYATNILEIHDSLGADSLMIRVPEKVTFVYHYPCI